MEMFKKVKKYILEADSIVLAAHERPDGDAIGSLGAMYGFLKQIGKEVYMVIPSPSKKMDFMPYASDAVESVPLKEYDLLITLDSSAPNRLAISKEDMAKAKKVIVIDHHVNNRIEGEYKLVVETAPANCEIIYDFLEYMNCDITKEIADYIYLGLMTDTGSFNYERTTAKTYKIAAKMLECGADFADICQKVNNTQTETKMQLIAETIKSIESYCEGKLRIAVLDSSVIQKYDVTDEDLDGLENYVRIIEGTKVAIYIRTLCTGIIKVSIRTLAPINAVEIASLYGGGGHVRAAGFETKNVEETKKELIEIVERLLESESNGNT